MDSSGIAALVNTHRRSMLNGSPLNGAALSVVNCRPNVRQVMEITEVYEILTGPSEG
jgi:anti-anti-sigma regulatory factor